MNAVTKKQNKMDGYQVQSLACSNILWASESSAEINVVLDFLIRIMLAAKKCWVYAEYHVTPAMDQIKSLVLKSISSLYSPKPVSF